METVVDRKTLPKSQFKFPVLSQNEWKKSLNCLEKLIPCLKIWVGLSAEEDSVDSSRTATKWNNPSLSKY